MMSSLYISATGLRTHGEGMASIGNNLANVNTVGFKQSMMLYEDLLSSGVNASSNYVTNMSQCGMGSSVLTNRTLFLQGGFEAGNDPMDLAISGGGFFGVAKDSVLEYTRAGNFRFDKEGNLIDPSGFSLMGHKVTNGVVSAGAEPIKLDLVSDNGEGRMPAKATGFVSLIENLGSTEDRSGGGESPFFSLAANWNGTSETDPLSASQYSHASPITVYDDAGNMHTLTAYFDYVGTSDGKKVYEYVLGVDPASDASAAAGTVGAGLLAAGTLTFSAQGSLEDMTMFNAPSDGNPANLSGWTAASFSTDGTPRITANLAGATAAQNISIDFGLEMGGSWSGGYATAADLAANPEGVYAGTGKPARASSCTSYEGASASVSQSQDGYTEGFIQSLAVDGEGYLTGKYSNNQSMQLYRIPLYRFTSQDNLTLEGSNHYSASDEVGAIESGFPGEENFGAIRGQELEQSNVDMAREFTTMITTQRGFQMNSKVITTSDQLLQKALEIKR